MSKYKISFIYAMELSSDSYDQEFDDLKSAKLALESITLYTLHLHDKQIMPDYSNVAFIQEYVDGEWGEVDEEEQLKSCANCYNLCSSGACSSQPHIEIWCKKEKFDCPESIKSLEEPIDCDEYLIIKEV